MAKSSPLSLRLPVELLEEIRAEARRVARPASQIIQATLEEGTRMRRCPGIIFTDGPSGRRATVAGTGIDVWEVVRVFRACGDDPRALERALPQLSTPHIQAALSYYRLYRDEINERIRLEDQLAAELESLPLVRRVEV
jgi:uncharacterized protein (DUF433 family)